MTIVGNHKRVCRKFNLTDNDKKSSTSYHESDISGLKVEEKSINCSCSYFILSSNLIGHLFKTHMWGSVGMNGGCQGRWENLVWRTAYAKSNGIYIQEEKSYLTWF